MKKIAPTFILGAQHSGTSILLKMLGQHPDFCWFSQFSQRGGSVPGRIKAPLYKHLNRILRSVFPHSWEKKDSKLKEFFVPRPGAADQILEYIFPKEEVVAETMERLKNIFESECQDWGKTFFITRLQELSHHIPVLKEVFPEAKFVHIVRDGRAEAASIKVEFIKEGEPIVEGLKRAGRNWVDRVSKIRKHKDAADIFEFRYEDFCGDVHGYLAKILDHFGLDKKRFHFDKFPKTLTSTNPKRIATLAQDELAVIEEVEKEYLKIYNYL